MWFWVEKAKIRLPFQGQAGTKKRIFCFFFHKLMTSRQSGKKQIPSVTGNLAQMIVCVHIVNM